MNTPEMGEKHRLDAKTSDIEAQSASISVVPNQILKICVATGPCGSKS